LTGGWGSYSCRRRALPILFIIIIIILHSPHNHTAPALIFSIVFSKPARHRIGAKHEGKFEGEDH
jgi:hypothetical protein